MQLNKFLQITALVVITSISGTELFAQDGNPKSVPEWTPKRICQHIEQAAQQTGLPKDFFARVIWTESRFDIKAVSPAGAQGIAQFMPATAKARGLADPFNPLEAIPASASLLAFHRKEFGNIALAAAAYNAGPGRVWRWLKGARGLPFETQNYVAVVIGKPADEFRDRKPVAVVPGLHETKPFLEACSALPVVKSRFRGLDGPRMPWGVQVSANFSRGRAMNSWLRVRSRLGLVTGAAKPQLHRQRTLRGLKSKWAVRLGAKDRQSAIQLCKRIRNVGGFCLVRRNR